jgi:hypothetical protein
MERFKRNQIEEAIFALLERRLGEPTAEFRTRVKRLLDTDRALGRSRRSNDPERSTYAFYSDEAPGSGVEIWFSVYEAFALLLGLQLMAHGWSQSFVVSVMRCVRSGLERSHADLMKQEWRSLTIDEQKRRARPGDWALNVENPVFLVLVPGLAGAAGTERMLQDWKVCHTVQDTAKFGRDASERRGGWVVFEIFDVSHALLGRLRSIEPRRRGRT